MAPSSTTTYGEDGLFPAERSLLESAQRILGTGDNNAFGIGHAEAGVLREALKGLANFRLAQASDLRADTRDAPPMDEIRDRIRLAVERLTAAVIRRDEVELTDAHSLAATARAFTLLGGDLELPDATANAVALEAEVRVHELEQAVTRVLDEAAPIANLGYFTGRLEDLGASLGELAEVRNR